MWTTVQIVKNPYCWALYNSLFQKKIEWFLYIDICFLLCQESLEAKQDFIQRCNFLFISEDRKPWEFAVVMNEDVQFKRIHR